MAASSSSSKMGLSKYTPVSIFMKVRQTDLIRSFFCCLGAYRAGVSMYMNAQCRVNFCNMPFRYPPEEIKTPSVLD